MALAPGTRLGPYTITVAIGAGGMGEVYKSTDTRLARTVAVKVLPERVASDPDLKQRFELEAKTLAALSHPHICPVFDVGSHNGIDFLVMEYLEGETLEQRLKKGALPLDQVLQLAIQTADALAAAHRAGIIHRDLKPGNVMLTKSGARLLDFGLAKTSAPAVAGSLSMLATTPPNLTVQGAMLGTFQYMAPEQVEGQEADPRTDIFAFGAMLYEAVTGKHAFEGKSHASLIAAILKDVPRPISTLQPLSPPLLERIVAKCLAKERDSAVAVGRRPARRIAVGGRGIATLDEERTLRAPAEIESRGPLQVYRSSSRRWRWPPGSTELACQARPAALKCALKSACRGASKIGWRFRPMDARSSQVDWLTGNGSSGCALSIR